MDKLCRSCGAENVPQAAFCHNCGTSLRAVGVLPPSQRTEQAIHRETVASQSHSPEDNRERRGGGYGCSAVTMGTLVVGFFVLIGVANGPAEGAGWVVVVFGVPVLVLSAVFLVAWHWAVGEMDCRNKAEAYRQRREEYLRELQIRDYEERDNT